MLGYPLTVIGALPASHLVCVRLARVRVAPRGRFAPTERYSSRKDALRVDCFDMSLWVAQGLLALAMFGSGTLKTITAREKLMVQMKWVRRFPEWAPRSIGIAEVAGALGIILPWATDILPILTPIAAACLLVLMVGAVKAHVDDDEVTHGIVPAVLGLLALFIATGRYVTLP